MELKDFDFPSLTKLEVAFPTVTTSEGLLKEAKRRGFYNGNTPYNKLFSSLFFGGGKITFKEGVDEDFKNRAWPYCRALMSSFSPRYEDKEAVCALIMSELIEPTSSELSHH